MSVSQSKSMMPSGQQDSHIERQITQNREAEQIEWFRLALNPLATEIEMSKLREKSWSGVPQCNLLFVIEFRAQVWRVLLGYESPIISESHNHLQEKRLQYLCLASKIFVENSVEITFPLNEEQRNWVRVIILDVPRTQSSLPFFQSHVIQRILSRVLIVWSINHPQCGYVQGINELATPLLFTLMGSYINIAKISSENFLNISKEILNEVEADLYWCVTKILNRTRDNFISKQPGIKNSIDKMRQVVSVTDPELARKLGLEGVLYVQFAFRWLLCFLVREFELATTCHIFDTLISDENGFEILYVYVCAALLLRFSKVLKSLKFNQIIMFLQNIPTKNWNEKDVRELFAQAFVLSSLYENAKGHFKGIGESNEWS